MLHAEIKYCIFLLEILIGGIFLRLSCWGDHPYIFATDEDILIVLLFELYGCHKAFYLYQVFFVWHMTVLEICNYQKIDITNFRKRKKCPCNNVNCARRTSGYSLLDILTHNESRSGLVAVTVHYVKSYIHITKL